jgi:hypothetical protein
MIKCDYAPCKMELSETTIKNFILDSVNENFSGFYCSHEHAGFDIIKNVFSDSNAFMTKAITELGLNTDAAVANTITAGPVILTPNIVPENIPVGDLDLDLITNVNQQVNNGGAMTDVVAMQPVQNEQIIKEDISKLNENMNSLIEKILTISSTGEYGLGKNVVPDAFMYKGVLVERYIFSLYSISPSFTFNITYSPEFVSFVFSNDSYNFKIVELNKIFDDKELSANSLYTRIVSIIKDANNIVDTVNVVIDVEPEPDFEMIEPDFEIEELLATEDVF